MEKMELVTRYKKGSEDRDQHECDTRAPPAFVKRASLFTKAGDGKSYVDILRKMKVDPKVENVESSVK